MVGHWYERCLVGPVFRELPALPKLQVELIPVIATLARKHRQIVRTGEYVHRIDLQYVQAGERIVERATHSLLRRTAEALCREGRPASLGRGQRIWRVGHVKTLRYSVIRNLVTYCNELLV